MPAGAAVGVVQAARRRRLGQGAHRLQRWRWPGRGRRARRAPRSGPAAAAPRRLGGGDADRALWLAEPVEVVAIALVKIAVEGLLLGQALGRIVTDGGAHIAEHRRHLAPGLVRSSFDVLARGGGECRRHPVEEGAVEARAGEGAHLRAHRGEHDAHAGEGIAQLGQGLAHRRQRLLREAGSDADPEPVGRKAELLDLGRDLLRVRRGRARSRRRRGRGRQSPSRSRRGSPGRWRSACRWTRSSRIRALRTCLPGEWRPRCRGRRRLRMLCSSARDYPRCAGADVTTSVNVLLQQRHALDVRGLREHVDAGARGAASSRLRRSCAAFGASVVGLHET